MAAETSNYKFIKHSSEEFFDVEHINENLDKVDQEIKKVDTKVDAVKKVIENDKAIEQLTGTDIVAYCDSIALNTSKIFRVKNGTNTPGTNGSNDYTYFAMRGDSATNITWTVIAYDNVTNVVYERSMINNNLETWRNIADGGNASKLASLPSSYYLRKHDLDLINIDSTPDNWVTNVSQPGHGTPPDSGFWNIIQWTAGHFFTQIASSTSGTTTTMIRSKYTSDGNWGPWRNIASSGNITRTLLTSETILNRINHEKNDIGYLFGSFPVQGFHPSDAPSNHEWGMVEWKKLGSNQYYVRFYIEWSNSCYDRLIVGDGWNNDWSACHYSSYSRDIIVTANAPNTDAIWIS